MKIKEASPSQIVATVIGTDNYRVMIDLDDFSAVCCCPYDLKGIKDFESEVKEIIKRLRRENKRKPAFIDELKTL